MAEISAKLVKELREKTGAGMMDCKAALTESQGDMENAVDWLRKKGLAKAAKKAGRIAAEGLIGIATAAKKGAVVEVNSETDFVARNAQFQDMVQTVAKLALKAKGDLDTLKATKLPRKTKTVEESITELVATIGEHMSLRRTALITVKEGVVASYVHGQVADGLGKIGVLVGLQSSGDVAKLEEFGRKVAMHVAAATPIALDINEVDPAVVEREKAVFRDQAKQSGKPDAVIEKMVEGRLRKFYEEVVLLKQTFVLDAEKTVEAAAKEAEKTVGAPIKITAFVRFALGEGIDKGESDFAAEVAAAAGKS